MISSLLKNQSSYIIGAAFILSGTTAAPSQATSLVGYSTFGDMMSGMRVTASFLNGASQSIIWAATGNGAGGAIGSGWSLTQAGNSFDSPWTFSNSGLGITSLVIDAIPGNTLFDVYPYGDNLPQTDGSADGWGFQTTLGPSPTAFAYTDVIDISQGDLFGTLSLYWTSGFAGAMQFRADTDSGSRNDPVQPKDPVVKNAPPTVSFSAPTINEGQSAATVISATDSGPDAITFFLNSANLGTDFSRLGSSSITTNLGYFADNGQYIYTAQARDEDGNYSVPVTSTLNVLNVAPTVTSLNTPTIYEGEWGTAYMTATDPGADTVSFFLNSNFVGTDPSTSGTRALTTNLGYFPDNTDIPYTAFALDKDGAWSTPAYSTLSVLNVAPILATFDLSSDTIYEGQSASGWLTATDPGADWLNFYVNNNYVGTDLLTAGTRAISTDLGTFTDEGDFIFTGLAQDKDSAFSNPLTKPLKVLNLAPTITQLTNNLVVKTNELFDFAAAAADPGINDLLTYDWDFNMDGLFDDFTGASGQWVWGEQGIRQVGLRVSDDDGGYAYSTFTVETVVPQTIPDPTEPGTPVGSKTVPESSSILSVLAFGAFGAGIVLKRKRKRGNGEEEVSASPKYFS